MAAGALAAPAARGQKALAAEEEVDTLALTDYADRYLVDRFQSVPGVSQVNLGGGQSYALRIWPDPVGHSTL